METAVVGVASELIEKAGEFLFGDLLISDDSGIDDCKHGIAFDERLPEQVRERGAGSETAVPRIAPDLMVEIQTFARIADLIRDKLLRGDRTAAEQVLDKCNLVSLGAVRICERAASEAERQDGSIDHGRCHLEVVAVCDRIIRLVDALREKTGDELHLHSI